MKEIESIRENAEAIKENTTHQEQSIPEKSKIIEKPELGFCIRCEAAIEYDYYHPYCYDCYKTWKKFKDRNYVEKVCHSCRQEWNTTMNHPVCDMCSEEYKKNK